jgi:hypothetical protein
MQDARPTLALLWSLALCPSLFAGRAAIAPQAPTPAMTAQGAAVELPAPFAAADERADEPGALLLRLDPDLHAALAAESRVVLRGFPVPDGAGTAFVDVELEQRAWRGVLGAPHVDGLERMDLFLSHDLSTWRGRVVGDPSSLVYLGFSRHGTFGFLRTSSRVLHVASRAAATGGGKVVEVAEREGAALTCGTEPAPPPPPGALARPPGPRGGGLPLKGFVTDTQHARIAVSVDYYTYALMGSDLELEIAYVYQLLWSVCDFYYSELQHPKLNFAMTVPYVELWTKPDDPWDECDFDSDTKDEVLEEFETKWEDIFDDEKVQIALLLCGLTIGGGKASGAGPAAEICEGPIAELGEHSVVGDIRGKLYGKLPPVQGPDTWEFVVIAHELGHNLGALHTDELGIDDCDDLDPTDCPMGTIMSYCHLCANPGENTLENIKLEFHQQNVLNLWFKLDGQDCLPLIGFDPLHVDPAYGGWPDGTPSAPYPSLFEALRLAGTLGGPTGIVRLMGALPGGLTGAQEWPALVLDGLLLNDENIVLEGWPSDSGATIGE